VGRLCMPGHLHRPRPGQAHRHAERFLVPQSVRVDRADRDVHPAAPVCAGVAVHVPVALQPHSRASGWPMSVFLTLDGRPFYGETYLTVQLQSTAIINPLPPHSRRHFSIRRRPEGVHRLYSTCYQYSTKSSIDSLQ
jgi:hypothetical protein